MAVPDYQSFMLPVLRYAGASPSKSIPIKELYDSMADEFALTDEERNHRLPSGAQLTYANRVGWAATYLKKAGLLGAPKRAHIQITDAGIKALKSNPKSISSSSLKQYPSFVDFQEKHKKAGDDDINSDVEPVSKKTPHEILESGYQTLRAELASDLLERVKSCTPGFFEVLVVELLVKMGYGGSRSDAGKALGKTGDEGIDGIIKEDKLGLDTIYIQAKRWKDTSVGRPAIQQFAGALAGQGAHKGIFITTSRFTEDARSFVSKVNSKIVLIDGEELAELMIDNGIGVSTAATYEVKRIDSDYFSDAEQ